MKNPKTDILIDGSQGEGGGQILRSSLTLSAITGQSFCLKNIRDGRAKPGLMRQHLTCVQAAAQICSARTSSVGIGTTELHFYPGKVEPCVDKTFAIGTAGSTSLLLQTILPILAAAESESRVTLIGGTHALHSPSVEYLQEIYLPALRQMDAAVDLKLIKYGFFPAGGGELELTVLPFEWSAEAVFHQRDSEAIRVSAEVINTPDIPEVVAEKELDAVMRKLPLAEKKITPIGSTACPGNALSLRTSGVSPGTLISVCGEKNKRSEQVAKEAVRWMKRYLNSPAPVDEHLADQLLLPMALAGGGSFTASNLTPHFYSNTEVVQAFLPIQIQSEQLDRFAWKVTINSK